MPIYEYQCQQCDHQLDALQRIGEAVLTECPSCKQPALRKLVSAPRFRLKGSGWYETDFKTGNKKNLAGDQDTKKDADKPTGESKDSKDSKSAGADADKTPKTSAKPAPKND